MQFTSTRDNSQIRDFTYSIFHPAAACQGLFAPLSLPRFDKNFFISQTQLSYKTFAQNIINKLDLGINQRVINQALASYDDFDNGDPLPLIKHNKNLYFAELFHGATRSFKDMALTPFARLFAKLAAQKDKRYLILTATSGDTGPAALWGFKGFDHIKVICMYPQNGTSLVQSLQMLHTQASNLHTLPVLGNFDEVQTTLKSLLQSTSFNEFLSSKNLNISVANSINFGRILFQTLYHLNTYVKLLAQGEHRAYYTAIPSGNFGNALAAYYAKKMGVPIKKIVIISNTNKVLEEFINSGVYDIRQRNLQLTKSPAMDILKASNIERLLFDLFGAVRTKDLIQDLTEQQIFKLTQDELTLVQEHFTAIACNDHQSLANIKAFASQNYIMDTHTANATEFIKKLNHIDKDALLVINATAEYSKFAKWVCEALDIHNFKDEQEALAILCKRYDLKLHPNIQALFQAKTIQTKAINIEEIRQTIEQLLEHHN